MNQYDSNVQKVMFFLDENNYSYSVKRMHVVCYQTFREYLKEKNSTYFPDDANTWLESNKELWNKWKYTGYRHCMSQLEDVYSFGTVKLEHTGPHGSDYAALIPNLRQELNRYLDVCKETDIEGYVSEKRISCSRFMMFLQKIGLVSIEDIDYAVVIEFHQKDFHRSWKTKDVYEDHIRAMFRYFAECHLCRFGYSVILSKLLIPHVILISDFQNDHAELIEHYRQDSLDFPASEFWDATIEFYKVLKEHRYALTVKKSSQHILTILYLFLDMHDLGYMPEISKVWFEEVKPLVGTGWKQWRRTLKLFEQFTVEGNIDPNVTYTYKADSLNILPDWCKQPLSSFLALKERESMTKSTVRMYKSSCLRFCHFLSDKGINSFGMVTPLLLNEFNENDLHLTCEGKNAYNVRIRGFLKYLEEQKLISGFMMHRALPCVFAPRERVVNVLSADELKSIDSYRSTHRKPMELRNIAMVMIGIKMGLRASDIVNLRFSDIVWKNQCITVIQQKTKAELSLPLSVEVGNSIYPYIRSGRPGSKSPYIFIHHTVPYGKLEKGACLKALREILPERNAPGAGFHVTRKTFATMLLRGGANVNLIVDSLGHRSDSTVSKYLSLDEEKMRLCPLTFSDAGIPLKGGLL